MRSPRLTRSPGNRGFARRRRDERGVESVAMLIVIPFLFVLILALIDVGMMFRTRIIVESMARDAARNAAADGGNLNPRTNNTGIPWSEWAEDALIEGGRCTQSRCEDGELPTVDCEQISPPNAPSYRSPTARFAGDLITCTIQYPYKGINKDLLDSPFGFGLGGLLKPFEISVSARAETGTNG